MPDPNRSPEPGRAWAPFAPDDKRPWDLRLAAHLYRRAGFGANWPQLEEALKLGPQRTVDKLLDPGPQAAAFAREHDAYEDAAASGDVGGLRAWWLRRMILTPHPLLEKMTLFWHDHFGTSAARVPGARLMLDHVQLLRRHALGDFRELLVGVARDPATLLSLGAAANRKALPNEDFARQILEQFALGPGNYTDEDVRDVARAFTGHFVLRDRLRFFDREHDPGLKTVLGHTGPFGSEDVVRIVAEQPAASALVVRKLYRWLISETGQPSDALLAPLAESFATDRDVGRLVETMLRSNLFFSEAAYRRRVKGPVEFAVGIVRGLEGTVPTLPLGNHLASLGQDLYRPPTVKGWAGGPAWINRATLVGRSNLAAALLAPAGPYEGKLDPAAVAREHGRRDAASAARFLVDLFLQGDVDGAAVDALSEGLPSDGDFSAPLRRFAHGLFTLPEFQLA